MSYTNCGEPIITKAELLEYAEEQKAKRFKEFCKTPKAVLIWLSKAAPMPAVMKLFNEMEDYELTDILEEIYEQNKRDIEEFFWCFKESYAC